MVVIFASKMLNNADEMRVFRPPGAAQLAASHCVLLQPAGSALPGVYALIHIMNNIILYI
jgi:hypothetical protein